MALREKGATHEGYEDSTSHGGDLRALALSSKDYPCSAQGNARGNMS